MAATPSFQTYIEATWRLLHRLFPCDDVRHNTVDLPSRTVRLQGPPGGDLGVGDLGPAELTAAVLAVAPVNPMVTGYLRPGDDGSPRRMTDLVPQREFENGPVYAELFRPAGGRFQMSILTATAGQAHARGWTLMRTRRDFTDDEVSLAAALRTPLALLDVAYQPMRPALATSARGAEIAFGLTARELEVLGRVAEGMTAQRIGHALGISPATVSKHLEHIYDKLDTHDRLLAVSFAHDHGWL